MTDEVLENLTSEYLELIVRQTKDTGGLPNHITLFATHKAPERENKSALIFLAMDSELMDSSEGKDIIVDVVIPKVAERVKKDYVVYGLAWASEAWLRESSLDKKIEDYQQLPIKKEVLIVSIETTQKSESHLYDLVRNGHVVNDEGNFIDNIELTKLDIVPDSTAGRFTGLLKNFL